MFSRQKQKGLRIATILKQWVFSRKSMGVDFSRYLGEAQLTSKQLLIEKCKKEGIPVHADDPTETSTGFYALFRCVASEAELKKRLNTKIVLRQAIYTNQLGFLMFVITLIPLIMQIFPL